MRKSPRGRRTLSKLLKTRRPRRRGESILKRSSTRRKRKPMLRDPRPTSNLWKKRNQRWITRKKALRKITKTQSPNDHQLHPSSLKLLNLHQRMQKVAHQPRTRRWKKRRPMTKENPKLQSKAPMLNQKRPQWLHKSPSKAIQSPQRWANRAKLSRSEACTWYLFVWYFRPFSTSL